jgi:hypothetical protein
VWKISEALSLFGISMQSISFIINLKRWWGLIFQKNTPDYLMDDDDDDFDDNVEDPIMKEIFSENVLKQ